MSREASTFSRPFLQLGTSYSGLPEPWLSKRAQRLDRRVPPPAVDERENRRPRAHTLHEHRYTARNTYKAIDLWIVVLFYRPLVLSSRSAYQLRVMGWFKRTYSQEELESAVSRAVSAAVAEVQKSQQRDSSDAMAKAVEGLFTRQLESFGKNTEALTGFLGAMSDLAVRRAAVALGSRGGRKRAENAERRKAAQPTEPTCQVRRNPNSKNSQSIIRHVSEGHDARRAKSSSQQEQLLLEHREFIQQNGGRMN